MEHCSWLFFISPEFLGLIRWKWWKVSGRMGGPVGVCYCLSLDWSPSAREPRKPSCELFLGFWLPGLTVAEVQYVWSDVCSHVLGYCYDFHQQNFLIHAAHIFLPGLKVDSGLLKCRARGLWPCLSGAIAGLMFDDSVEFALTWRISITVYIIQIPSEHTKSLEKLAVLTIPLSCRLNKAWGSHWTLWVASKSERTLGSTGWICASV